MTAKILHKPHALPHQISRKQRPTSTESHAEAETLLRDMAFVLKMTQRVREEMEADAEVQEPVLV